MANSYSTSPYTQPKLVLAHDSNNSSSSTPPPPPPKPAHVRISSLAGPPLPPHPDHQTMSSAPGEMSLPYGQAAAAILHDDQSIGQRGRYTQEQQQDSQSQCDISPLAIRQLPHEDWLPPNIAEKPKQYLQELLSTSALLVALTHASSFAHPSLNASTHHIKQIANDNIALANKLLSLEATLASRRDHAQQRLLSVRALEQQWRKKQAELEARLEAFGPRVLHQRLTQGINEQDAVCHGLEDSFLEGQGLATEREVGEWVRRVREARKIASLRRERKGRWDEGRVGGWR